MGEKKESASMSIGLSTLLLLGIMVGILLSVIGAATNTDGAMAAGVIIVTVSLFSGGFLLKDEESMIRLGMILAGGLVLGFSVGLV